jgi:hypothetical protein
VTFPDIPTVANGRVLFVTQANTTTTRTFPNLSSLTKNSGDLLIAIGICYSASTTPQWGTWGGGFTEFFDGGSAGTINFGMAYKFSDGTETGTFTAVASNSGAGHFVGILLSIPGAHASTPPVSINPGTGTTVAGSAAALNPADWDVEDTLWIGVCGVGETATGGSFTGVTGAPTNYTDFAASSISQDAVGGVQGAVAFRQLAAASEDITPFSVDLSNARNATTCIAVRPAPSVTTVESGAVDFVGVNVITVNGRQDIPSGGVTHVGVNVLTPLGRLTISTSVTLAGSNTLAVTPTIAREASVTLASTNTVSVTPKVDRVAAVTLAGTNTVTVSGRQNIPSAVTLAGTNTVTISGRQNIPSAVTLAGTNTVSVTPAVATQAEVTLAGTNVLTVTPRLDVRSAVTLAGANVLTISGRQNIPSTVTLAGINTLVVTGRQTISSAVAFAGVNILTVTGRQDIPSTVTLAGVNVLTVTGSVGTNIPMVNFNTLTISGLLQIASGAVGFSGVNVLIVTGSVGVVIAIVNTSTLTVSGRLTITSNIVMAGANILAVAVLVQKFATANLVGVNTLSVSVLIQALAVATMPGTNVLTISSRLQIPSPVSVIGLNELIVVPLGGSRFTGWGLPI